jgi:hypothetical protein
MKAKRVTLVLIRHSKSCSNHVRSMAKDHKDRTDPTVQLSQRILDPGLTRVGREMAEVYGPALQQKLREAGIQLATAKYGSSALKRAKETVSLLFPEKADQLLTVPHFTEHGEIPENTPTTGLQGKKPDWEQAIDWFGETLRDGDQLIAVGHGSYLRSHVAADKKQPLHNLDGFRLDVELIPTGKPGDWTMKVLTNQKIPYNKAVSPDQPDQCMLTDATKIVAHTKKMAGGRNKSKRRSHRHKRRTQRRRSQKGAGVTLPLAYFQNGAQFQGTSPTPTGTGLTTSTGLWSRTPLQQTGGACQDGGFSPSVMGAFGTHMATVIPVASYVGYKMYKNGKKRD